MKLTPELKAGIDAYFNNISPEELFKKSVINYGFEEVSELPLPSSSIELNKSLCLKENSRVKEFFTKGEDIFSNASKMKLELETWKVTKLAFLIREGKIEDGGFQINLSNKFPSISTDLFELIFELSVTDPFFELNLTSSFIFKYDQGITEEFKTSDLPRVNAPAIAFPFLRAYISNLTLQSGISPLVLPSINFLELGKRNRI